MKARQLRNIQRKIKSTDIWDLLSILSLLLLLVSLCSLALLKIGIIDESNAHSGFIVFSIESGLCGLIVLLADYRNWIAKIWRHPVTKILVTIIAFTIGIISLNFADEFIARYTSLTPSTFSRAQAFIASIISIYIWVMILSLIFFAAYIAQVVVIMKKAIFPVHSSLRFKPYRALRILFSMPRSYKQTGKLKRDFTIFSSLAIMLTIAFPLFLSSATSDSMFRTLFVISSFYQNHSCNKLASTDEISLIGNNQVVFIEDKSKLTFKVTTCN